ncbi:hypothetical protein PV342_29680 [Streptomyces sp. PA03-3a]|nr:hypothetical protein [Streptomyces sp. PA03-3a]
MTAYAGALPGFLGDLRDRHQTSRPRNETVRHVVGQDQVNELIASAHSTARKEILSAQPGPRTPFDLSHSFGRDHAAVKQGISMRTMYHSSVRRVATVGNWAKEMAAAGAEIRTFNGRFERSIIFDRRVCFVRVHAGEGEPPGNEAVMISDPLVVGVIAQVFELFWERADPWIGRSNGKDDGLITTAGQRAVLRELCLGRTQAQAAKNLGISAAWANSLLGDLRKTLGVETLNEVIYWWATSPDHDVQD